MIALAPQEGRDFQVILLDAPDRNGATAMLIEAGLRRGRRSRGGALGVFGVRGRGLRRLRRDVLALRLRLRLRRKRLYRILLATGPE